MKVRITAGIGYGSRNGQHYRAGQTVELPDALAVKLIQHRIAEPVRERPVETAEVSPPDNMAPRSTKPRPRRAK